MTNRKKLVEHLKSKKHILSDDPLYHTRSFLRKKQIPEKLFFNWLIENIAKPYNYNINNDRDIRIVLQ
jgi:hypothetical protein